MGKKQVTMSLGDFLEDESIGGSWADDGFDVNALDAAITSTAAPIGPPASENTSFGAGGYGSRSQFGDRPERKEYPVPDAPPYRARVNNLPWDATEDALTRFFEGRTQMEGSVTEVDMPMDLEFSRPKGFAFVTFSERAGLEEALLLNMADFNGRRVFVNVAAPGRGGAFDGDWKGVRGSGMISGGPEDREDVVLDWGSARNSRATLPPRERFSGDGSRPERSERFERAPRDPEPNLDWSAARGAAPPPCTRIDRGSNYERSERPAREPEPEIDWKSARQTRASLPPREPRENSDRRERSEYTPKAPEPEIDWSSARRGPSALSSRPERLPQTDRFPRTNLNPRTAPKTEPDMDWSRGKALASRARPSKPKTPIVSKKTESSQDAPKQSVYSVLPVEGEDSDEVDEDLQGSQKTGLEMATSKLSVKQDSDDGWQTVHK